YDSVWSTVTRQFIPYLINTAEVKAGMSMLDVACGPGYVSDAVRKAGATPKGIDFSEKMIAIAKTTFPDLFFIQGDAQNLPFEDAGFRSCLDQLRFAASLRSRKGMRGSVPCSEVWREIWFHRLGRAG